MKKLIYLFVLGIGFTPCSVESLDFTENILTADIKAKLAAAETLDPMSFYAGGKLKNLKGTLAIWNDCDNLYVKITPSGDDLPDDVLLGIFEDSDLPSTNGGSGNVNTSNFLTLADSENLIWTADIGDASSFNIFIKAYSHWAGNSSAEGINQKYNIYQVEEVTCCEESFTYVNNGDNTYTFNYTAEEDLKGAELSMTFPQAVVSAPSNWYNPGNAVSSPEKTTMDLVKCQTYSWIFTLTPDCSKGKNETPNLWVDFTVNEITKKGDLSNIIGSCPKV